MTVVEAMDAMMASAEPGSERARIQRDLLAQLHRGHSLSEALRNVPGFPPVLIASVAAAERSSKLIESLDEYLRYSAMIERLRRQVVSAAVYPLVVTSLGISIAIFLMVFVIPRFARMYAELPAEALGGATRLVVQTSQVLTNHSALALLGVAAIVVATVASLRSGRLAALMHTLISKVPLLRSEAEHFRLTQLYQALSLMMRGGYPLHEALEVCVRMTSTGHSRRQLVRVQQAVSTGRPLSDVFAEAGLADAVSARLLAVGERTGDFDVVLQTIAERHGQHFSTFIERATRVVEPMLLLAVAVMVGGIVIVMYLPIFDIAGQMGAGR